MLQILFFSVACYMILNSFLSGTNTGYIIGLLAIALALAVSVAKKK